MYQKGQRTRLDSTIRLIENMFYHQAAIERAVREAREDSGKGKHTGGAGGHSYVSDPTAIQGVNNAMEIPCVTLDDGSVVHRPEAWLRVIHATYNQGDDTQKRAVKMRYYGYTWDYIYDQLHISKTTYYFLLDQAHKYAIAAACQEKVIKLY